jgi:prevent-host-death family protein
MKSVNIHEAKTHLSALLEEVQAGEQIIIAKAGRPIARLVPLESTELEPRTPGTMKGKIRIHADFDAPLPSEIAAVFGWDQ